MFRVVAKEPDDDGALNPRSLVGEQRLEPVVHVEHTGLVEIELIVCVELEEELGAGKCDLKCGLTYLLPDRLKNLVCNLTDCCQGILQVWVLHVTSREMLHELSVPRPNRKAKLALRIAEGRNYRALQE